MNIYIDNGSGHIMTKRMEPYLRRAGHKVCEHPWGCDVQLAFVRFGVITKLPKVVRIDGIYYNTSINWKEQNRSISDSHSIADGIIYQSQYSRMLCENLLAKRKKSAHTAVIYNGITPNWCGIHLPHNGFNIVITGKHRRHKRLKEIIDVFLKFHEIKPDSCLHVFGMLYDNKKIDHPAIKYYGQVDRSAMFDVLQRADLSIHISKRDSCPNSVVEYLGAGIPVITTDNCGGATEMCAMTPGCIIVKGDGSYTDINPVPHYSEEWNELSDSVFQGILKGMLAIYEDRRRVQLPSALHIENVTNRYIQLLKKCLRD